MYALLDSKLDLKGFKSLVILWYDIHPFSGCDQWYFGSGATNAAETFNYQSGNGKHLANQHQTICVR